jgi:hypothetical protein
MQSKWDSGPIILIYPINISMDLLNINNEFYLFLNNNFSVQKPNLIPKIKWKIILEQLYYMYFNTKPKNAQKGGHYSLLSPSTINYLFYRYNVIYEKLHEHIIIFKMHDVMSYQLIHPHHLVHVSIFYYVMIIKCFDYTCTQCGKIRYVNDHILKIISQIMCIYKWWHSMSFHNCCLAILQTIN